MPILNFHNVLGEEPDDFDDEAGTRMRAEAFESTVEDLRSRYRLVGLGEYVEATLGGVTGLAAITFDDGYHGVTVHAWPVLRGLGIPAAVFVITGTLHPEPPLIHFEELEIAFRITKIQSVNLDFLGGGNRGLGSAMSCQDAVANPVEEVGRRAKVWGWSKRRLRMLPDSIRRNGQQTLLERLEVTPQDCRAAAAGLGGRFRKLNVSELGQLTASGWEIGSHTRAHRVLSRLQDEDLREEVEGSREDLRAALNLDVIRSFAYPYGGSSHIGDAAAQAVRAAGYERAFTMIKGGNPPGTDPLALRRLDIRDFTTAQ